MVTAEPYPMLIGIAGRVPLHRQQAAAREILDVQEIADLVAGPPNLERVELLDRLAHQRGNDVAGSGIEVVMRPVHRGRPDQGDLDVGAAGDEFGEVLEVAAHPAIAEIGRMRRMLRRFLLADGMVGRGINGAAAEDRECVRHRPSRPPAAPGR